MLEKVKIKKFDDFISMPIRAHETDAGADVFATEDVLLKPYERYSMTLGFGLEVPKGYKAEICTKSGTFLKGIICEHGAPVDAGYSGNVHALLININDSEYTIHKGDKIAQLVITAVETPEFEIVEEIEAGERGENGFGSTGDKL